MIRSTPVAASRTAAYVAAYRAIETVESRPHFRDPFAAAFLPRDLARLVVAARFPPARALLVRYADRRAPGARTSAIARTCLIDEVTRGAVQGGVRQMVV